MCIRDRFIASFLRNPEITDAIHALLQNHMPDHYTEKQQEYIKLFVCQGGYAIIRQWLNKENRETPEEIASLLNALSTLILRPL